MITIDLTNIRRIKAINGTFSINGIDYTSLVTYTMTGNYEIIKNCDEVIFYKMGEKDLINTIENDKQQVNDLTVQLSQTENQLLIAQGVI